MPAGSLSIDPAELDAAARYGLLQQGHPPSCIVRPGNVDELGALIRYANQTGLSLAVTSSAGGHRRGGITNQGEHILVDLSRLEADRPDRPPQPRVPRRARRDLRRAGGRRWPRTA